MLTEGDLDESGTLDFPEFLSIMAKKISQVREENSLDMAKKMTARKKFIAFHSHFLCRIKSHLEPMWSKFDFFL